MEVDVDLSGGGFAQIYLHYLENSIAMGPYDENHASSLATARSDLVAAKQAYQNALNPLRSNVNEELSASQRTTWTGGCWQPCGTSCRRPAGERSFSGVPVIDR